MKKKVFKKQFDDRFIVRSITNEGLEFSNGVIISDYHSQDCCGNVYADWEALRTTNITLEQFKKLEIRGHEDSGIIINGYFVPCYNSQNGYYSDKLELKVKEGDVTTTIDISEYVEDDIFD